MLQLLVEQMEAAGVQPAYTQRLSPEGHPRGDPNDSTSSAVAQGVGAAVLMARYPSGAESVTPTSFSLAQGRGPPAGAQSVDSPGEVFSPPDPPPPPPRWCDRLPGMCWTWNTRPQVPGLPHR